MKKRIIFLFLLSLILRLIFLFKFEYYTRNVELMDSLDYQIIARNILEGKGFIGKDGFPTESRPPIYPIFLAGIYKLFNHSNNFVKFFQCLIDSFRIIAIFYITYDIFGFDVALFSVIINSIYPPYIVYSNIILTECLFSFFIAVFCLYFVKSFNSLKLRDFILMGIFQGLATLTKGILLFFPFFVFIFIVISGKIKLYIKKFIIYLIVGSIIISIWTVRNYSVFNSFIPVSTGGGGLIWLAMQENAWNGDVLVELHPLDVYKDLRGLPWYKWEKIVARRAILEGLKKPFRYAKILFKNFLRLWSLPVGKVLLGKRNRLLAIVYKFIFILVSIISFYGILSSIFDIGVRKVGPILLMIIYVSIMHSILIPLPRYRLPFEQFMLIFFSYSLYQLYSKYFRKEKNENFNYSS